MTRNNKGLIITVIALLCVIAVLLTSFMGYVIHTNNSKFSFFDWSENNKKINIIYDESFDSAAISAINIDSECGDIDIKQSTDNTIRIVAHGTDEKLFSISNDNGTITINNKASDNKTKFVYPFGNYTNIGIDVDIYMPADCIERLEINSNFGDVKMNTLSNINLKINCDMGNIKAENISGKFDLHTDMGDVEIERINITENSYATSDIGDIEIEHTNDIKINYSTSMGECDVRDNDNASITLTAETSMGDIEINN